MGTLKSTLGGMLPAPILTSLKRSRISSFRLPGQVDHILARDLQLEQDGRRCSLFAPPDHRLDEYRNVHPLYDRRLPLLSRLLGNAAPASAMVDVGANIGDTVALCRMAGCKAPIVAIEPSAHFFAFLQANHAALPEIYKDVHCLRTFIGAGSEQFSLIESAGTAHARIVDHRSADPGAAPTMQLSEVTDREVSLIKTDTDGYDAKILLGSLEFLRQARPVLWAEAEVNNPDDELSWRALCSALEESHPQICIFDNFGFLLACGSIAEKQAIFLDTLAYIRRHKMTDETTTGRRPIHYLDVAFFPAARIDVYYSFSNALIENI